MARREAPLNLAAALGVEAPLGSLPRKVRAKWAELVSLGTTRLERHGDFASYLAAILALPEQECSEVQLQRAAPRVLLPKLSVKRLEEALLALAPWKKGPFELAPSNGTITLDAEWRSDMKWERLVAAGVNFTGKSVVDVGTGNGYFLYRCRGAGARRVLGIEPGVLSVSQFLLLQRLYRVDGVGLLPVTSSEFAYSSASFDIVMSMGVLYHRRSPLGHLNELKELLRPGGQLVLETLALSGPLGFSLVPEGRYAQMRNVFFLPSPETLASWLRKVGFRDIELFPLSITSVTEQRSTPWMTHPSLDAFLEDAPGLADAPGRLTIEGHPRPQRLLVTARKPQ